MSAPNSRPVDPSLREDQVGGLGRGGDDAAVRGREPAEVGVTIPVHTFRCGEAWPPRVGIVAVRVYENL